MWVFSSWTWVREPLLWSPATQLAVWASSMTQAYWGTIAAAQGWSPGTRLMVWVSFTSQEWWGTPLQPSAVHNPFSFDLALFYPGLSWWPPASSMGLGQGDWISTCCYILCGLGDSQEVNYLLGKFIPLATKLDSQKNRRGSADSWQQVPFL